jgi:hypothetical protein
MTDPVSHSNAFGWKTIINLNSDHLFEACAVIASLARSEVGALLFWLTSGLAWTGIRLDAVSVRIDDEGGVVVGA